MPDESEFLHEKHQHQERCPSCLSYKTRLAMSGGASHMGCDECGHVWVGKDFPQNDQAEERTPIPETDPPDTD